MAGRKMAGKESGGNLIPAARHTNRQETTS
jgi:hypothetical protein